MPNNLGDTLKQARKAIGMSQKKLSLLSGISEDQIRNIETGRTKRPQRINLIALAQYLKLDFEELISQYYEEQDEKKDNILGKTIRQAREEKRLSQYQLSKLSGIAYSQICNIEKGKTKNPKWQTLSKLARCLNLKAEDLRLL